MDFWRNGKFARQLSKFVKDYEKVILALLAVVIVISGTIWFREFSGKRSEGPTVGGSYIEGIVAEDGKIQSIATRLTKAGLFRVDSTGKLANVLVQAWQSNAEKTEYQFELIPGVNAEEIAQTLEINLELLGPATITTEGDRKVVLRLEQSNPNVPLLLTSPIFDYGPFRVGKTTAETTVFTRNTREGALKPYLNKIVIHAYNTEGQLKEALERGKLSGAENHGLTLPDKFTFQTITYQRYYAVIFNLNKSPFRDTGLRKALINGEQAPANQPFTLTVADQEPYKSLAQELVGRWQSQGAQVTVEFKPLEEIQTKIGPSRTFQALLTGINYGMEMDPYYLWHSSQLRPPGNNISGLKSDVVDALLAQTRGTIHPVEREVLIRQLHEELTRQSAALVLKQETSSFVVSESVTVQKTWSPLNDADRFLSITDWSVR